MVDLFVLALCILFWFLVWLHRLYLLLLIYGMLPLKKIYIDSRHSTKDSKSSSNDRKNLLVNISLPPNAAFYILDITIPVSWCTFEAGRNYFRYFRIIARQNPNRFLLNALSVTETLTPLLFAVLSAMIRMLTTQSILLVPHANLVNNTIFTANNEDTFQI